MYGLDVVVIGLDPEELKAVFDGLGETVDQQVIDNLVFLVFLAAPHEDGNGTIEFSPSSSCMLKEMSIK